MDVDAWGSKTTGILLDDGLALRTNLEGADCEMRKLQAGFDGYTACTEADVPEDMSLGKFEGLQCEQANRHLGNHLLTAVE